MTFFFVTVPATSEIYTLSLHDALPILNTSGGKDTSPPRRCRVCDFLPTVRCSPGCPTRRDRKSTRLNSSHTVISYAVFCLKKKNMVLENITSSRFPSTTNNYDITIRRA